MKCGAKQSETLNDGETIHCAFFDQGYKQGPAMKLHCYPEIDSLYFELKAELGVEIRKVFDSVSINLHTSGEVAGFNLDRASGCFSWPTRDTKTPPIALDQG